MSDGGGPDLERDGVDAFVRLADAVADLRARLDGLARDLASRVEGAEHAAEAASQAAATVEAAAGRQARTLAAWIGSAAFAGVLAAGGAGYLAGRAGGWDHGQADGYARAADERAAASWANSPDGRLALAMDRAGTLAMLTGCSGRGWRVERRDGRRVCYPAPDPAGSVVGWFLP